MYLPDARDGIAFFRPCCLLQYRGRSLRSQIGRRVFRHCYFAGFRGVAMLTTTRPWESAGELTLFYSHGPKRGSFSQCHRSKPWSTRLMRESLLVPPQWSALESHNRTHAGFQASDRLFHQASGFFEYRRRTDASWQIWDMGAIPSCCWCIQYGVVHFLSPACLDIAA